MSTKYRGRTIIFILVLFSNTAFAVVHFTSKERQEFSKKLIASCMGNADVPKGMDKALVCECVTRNHLLFSEYRNKSKIQATNEMTWVLNYYSGKFSSANEEFKKDPFSLMGPDGDGALFSINSDCLRDNKYHYVIP